MTRLEKSGRILIPAALRRELALSPGSQVLIKIESTGALQITSRAQILAKVRQEIRKYIPAGQDLANELIRDRQTDIEHEEQEASR